MNAQVLNNQFSKFWCNKQKAIAWAKARVTHDWDQLQSDALQIKTTSKSTLVRLVSFELLALLGIPTWGVGSMPPNVVTKLKKDNDFVNLIRISKVFYAKGHVGCSKLDKIFKQKGMRKGNHSSCSLSWNKNGSWSVNDSNFSWKQSKTNVNSYIKRGMNNISFLSHSSFENKIYDFIYFSPQLIS